MIDSTIPVRLDDAPGRRISSSSGSPLAPPKASLCVLDLLGHARPQAHAAVKSIILAEPCADELHEAAEPLMNFGEAALLQGVDDFLLSEDTHPAEPLGERLEGAS